MPSGPSPSTTTEWPFKTTGAVGSLALTVPIPLTQDPVEDFDYRGKLNGDTLQQRLVMVLWSKDRAFGGQGAPREHVQLDQTSNGQPGAKGKEVHLQGFDFRSEEPWLRDDDCLVGAGPESDAGR